MNPGNPKLWHCPLCDWAGEISSVWEHGHKTHSSVIPNDVTTLQVIDLIPVYIAEVEATAIYPNPGDESEKTGRPELSRPPLNLSVAELLAPYPKIATSYSHPLILLVECSRVCWEAVDDEIKASHPQPDGDPTFASEATWLADLWPDAQDYLDEVDIEWVSETVRTIVSSLARAAKIGKKARLLCPDCQAPMRLSDDGWLTCEAGHQHPGPVRLRDEWRRKPPMTTRQLCEALRIPEGTVYAWKNRGKLQPSRSEAGATYWLPWDVISLRYPDIATQIDEALVTGVLG